MKNMLSVDIALSLLATSCTKENAGQTIFSLTKPALKTTSIVVAETM
jgi:hypothetical protein